MGVRSLSHVKLSIIEIKMVENHCLSRKKLLMGVLASFQMGVHGLISVNLAEFDMNHLTITNVSRQ